MATSLLPSRGPKRGRNCYVTPAFSGIPKIGDIIRSGYITPAFSGVPLVGKDQSGYMTSVFSGFPIVGRHEQETKWCLFSMQEWCLSMGAFPPPDFGGSIEPPPHPQLKT